MNSCSVASASRSELFDANCDSSSPIRALLHANVDYNAPILTSRKDALLIASMPRINNDNKFANDEDKDEHDSKRRS